MTTIAAVLCATAAAHMLTGVERARAVSAARYLAQLCGSARFEAVGRGRVVALHFFQRDDEYVAQLVEDGNRNGVRAAEIASGVDRPFGSAEVMSRRFPGVRIALDPAIGTGPVALSGSMLWSFTPGGTATAGSVYILGRDGTQLAVRVLGVTGRTRVVRYERSTGTWEQL